MKTGSWNTFGTLGQIDSTNIFRDPFLKWFVVFPVLIVVAVRFGVPPLRNKLIETSGFDIAPFYPLFSGFMLIVMPLLVGILIGFLLLDQKEDGTFTALQVTPVSPGTLLAYRMALPTILATLMTVAMLVLMNLHEVNILAVGICSLAAAPLAPVFALFLAAFARNKVQGFALSKANGFITLPPLVAWFYPEPFQWLFGLAPTFWPVKAFWISLEDPAPFVLCIAASFAYFAVILFFLQRRWSRINRS